MHCKGEAQKSLLFLRFSGGFCFSQDRLFSRNSTRKPLNLKKSPFLQTPLVKPPVFTMHLVCTLLIRAHFFPETQIFFFFGTPPLWRRSYEFYGRRWALTRPTSLLEQISSDSLWEGCSPCMVTLRIFFR